MKYSVKATALATGISEARLRTWERRYGVPKPSRSGSGRRQYDEADIAVIRRMASLVDAGIPASEAAVVALTEETVAAPTAAPTLHPAARAVAEAGMRFAEEELIRLLNEAIESMGWDDALDQVFLGALRLVGESWHDNAIPSANEHFTTEVIRSRMIREISSTDRPRDESLSILLACPEDERHDVGLLAVRLLLGQRGLRTYYLGADVPAADLALALIQTKSDALCLAVTLPQAAANAGRAVRELIAARISARIFIGGPGIVGEAGDSLPGIRLPERVGDAARVLAETVQGN
jgi:methanogenic corrinoid protein MtbC1